MEKTQSTLIKNSLWVIGGFGLSQVLRLVSNVILARLLSPDIFGIMVVVYSIRGGIDLLSDIGIQQSIIANKQADDPNFYNTAWTLRFLRGILIATFCFLFAKPLAGFYDTPILLLIMPVIGLSFAILGAGSLGPLYLQKQLRSARLSVFELGIEVVTLVSQIVIAWLYPTVWVLVIGVLINSMARTVGSYIIAPEARYRFFISTVFAKQIFSFGGWFFLSSLIFFLSANFDRLYLGKMIALEILGVYGIARNLSDIAVGLVTRLNFMIIFPFIASHSEMPRSQLRSQMMQSRTVFLLIAAAGIALLVVSSDWIIAILYDTRYRDAGWMLGALLLGVWFSVLCTINESTLLGFSRPSYGVYSNGLKLVWVVVGLLSSATTYGINGVVVVVLFSDIWRYIPILLGQRRERFSFLRLDILLTGVFFSLIGAGELLRWSMGLGISLAGIWPQPSHF